MKNVLQLLPKHVLIPLGLKSKYQQQTQEYMKKVFGSGTTTIIISKEEMEDIMNIVKPLEDSGKALVKQFKMKQRNKKSYLSVCYWVH